LCYYIALYWINWINKGEKNSCSTFPLLFDWVLINITYVVRSLKASFMRFDHACVYCCMKWHDIWLSIDKYCLCCEKFKVIWDLIMCILLHEMTWYLTFFTASYIGIWSVYKSSLFYVIYQVVMTFDKIILKNPSCLGNTS
jgi:hypothetical protein